MQFDGFLVVASEITPVYSPHQWLMSILIISAEREEFKRPRSLVSYVIRSPKKLADW